MSYLVRLAIEKRGGDYLAYPQQALLDRLGIRTMVLDTDAYGNFLTQGYVQGSARDWARLANFYLQDGVWNGERLLAPGYVGFLRTPAPAWVADGYPVYGGFFWLNGDGALPAPRDAFFMSGVAGQRALMVPSHDLVIVRLGHSSGEAVAETAFARCVARALDAIPATHA